MEIHELNTKALTDPAYVPFDDGTDTYKAEFNEVVEDAANAAVAAADLTNNSVAFTSGDAASPTAWSSVSVITSGSTLATLFNRISTMVKNVRWLYSKLGTTDISSIGNGTVTGAISALNGKIAISGKTNAELTINSTYIDSSNVRMSRCGRVCIISGWIKLKANPPSNTIIVSGIPAPYSGADQNIIAFNQNDNSIASFTVNTGGISCAGYNYASHVNDYLNILGSYITNT